MEHISRAKEILKENIYLTMATSDKDGNPWITPVRYANDDHYNFYWISEAETRHSKNIKENKNKVSFVVYNSSTNEGTGEGVYFKGSAHELTEQKDAEEALNLYFARKNQKPKSFRDFIDAAPQRIYKAIPEKIWMKPMGIVEKVQINLL